MPTGAVQSAETADQLTPAPPRGDSEGAGPFRRLVIRSAMVIDGTGTPPQGPMDIVIEGNKIVDVVNVAAPHTPIDPANRPAKGDYELDASGMFVLPGFVDTHAHYGDPQKAPEAEYVNKLWLAHGVTSIRGVPTADLDFSLSERARSARNETVAPRIFVFAVAFEGQGWSSQPEKTPQRAREWVRFAKKKGADGIKIFGADPNVAAALFAEAESNGLGSVAHLAPHYQARLTATDAVNMGLDSITHSYGLFESLYKDTSVQNHPANYNYFDEQDRWDGVAANWDKVHPRGSEEWNAFLKNLMDHDVFMSPTYNVIVGTRDIQRVYTFEWHDKYTLPSLMEFYQPSRTNHASQWYYWTSERETQFKNYYRVWGQLINDYNRMGGRVTAGSDAGWHYQTYGFAYIDELQMLRETGMTPLEVIRSATLFGAEEIYSGRDEEPPFGTIRPGKLADLILVDENPLENLKIFYGTGWMKLDDTTGEVKRVGRIKHTIKDGIIYDPEKLLEDVAAMVEKQKQNLKGQTVIRQGLPVIIE
jgi:hypothetical protein